MFKSVMIEKIDQIYDPVLQAANLKGMKDVQNFQPHLIVLSCRPEGFCCTMFMEVMHSTPSPLSPPLKGGETIGTSFLKGGDT
jgi:hypothetical protein